MAARSVPFLLDTTTVLVPAAVIKSSLLAAAATLITPDRGTVVVDDVSTHRGGAATSWSPTTTGLRVPPTLPTIPAVDHACRTRSALLPVGGAVR